VRLYSAALELPHVRSRGSFELGSIANEEWHALYNSLGRKLGKLSTYWQCFNPYDEELVAGSLADDLADIYRDMKPGMAAYRTGRKDAIAAAAWEW